MKKVRSRFVCLPSLQRTGADAVLLAIMLTSLTTDVPDVTTPALNKTRTKKMKEPKVSLDRFDLSSSLLFSKRLL